MPLHGPSTLTVTLAPRVSRSGDGVRAPQVFARGELLAERFRVERLLGEGGMGQVFEALDLELGVPVALKVIRPERAGSASAAARFKREVQLARQVTHTNVCRIYDLVQHKDAKGWGQAGPPKLLLTMELLRGETLAERLARTDSLTPEEAVPLIRDMADALDAAHLAGVVHRDFKSSNVMLVPGGDGMRAVVTDFGLARTQLDGRPEQERPVESLGPGGGTPAYMAPEQLLGEKATAASDIYSFGVVIYEMLTGTRPFCPDAPGTVPRRLVEAPPSLRTLRPDLDERWERTILRCLARHPEERFARARDVAQALTRRRPFARQRALLSLAAMAAVTGAALWLGPSLGVPAPETTEALQAAPVEARPSVALLDFRNLTAQPENDWLSTALAETLRAQLALGEQVRTIPGENVQRMKQELGIEEPEALGGDLLDGESLRRVHEYLGTDFIVQGSFLLRDDVGGSQLRLHLVLRDAAAGEILASFTELGTESRLFELISRVGTRLRGHLGLSLEDGFGTARARTGLPDDREAARLYARGLARLRSRDFHHALDLFEQAARKAPRAARVQAALASSWTGLGYDGRAEAAARRALELADGLTRQERLLIEALHAETLRDWPQARRIYESLCTVFPDTPDYGLRLAAVETAGGFPQEALKTVGEVRRRFGPGPQADLAEAEAARMLADLDRQAAAAARAAEASRDLGAELLLARARLLEGEALSGLGRIEEATKPLAEARKIYLRRGDRRSLAESLVQRVDFVPAEEMGLGLTYEEALETFREVGDQRGIARALVRVARTRVIDDRYEEARQLLDEALRIARQIDNRLAEAEALNVLAILTFFEDDIPESTRLFGQAVDKARESGNQGLLAGVLSNYGNADLPMTLLEAREIVEESVALARNMGSRVGYAMTLFKSSTVLRQTGELVTLRERCQECLRIAEETDTSSLRGLAQNCLGYFHLDRGEISEARRRFTAAGDSLGTVRVLRRQGDLSQAETALAALLAKVREASSREDPAETREFQLLETEILLDQGRIDEAREVFEADLAGLAWREETSIFGLRVRRVSARIAAATGRGDEARRDLEALLRDAVAFGSVLAELEARLELGRLLLASGHDSAASTELAAVARRGRELGYDWLAQQALRR